MGSRQKKMGRRKARRVVIVTTLFVGIIFAGYNKVEAFLTGGTSPGTSGVTAQKNVQESPPSSPKPMEASVSPSASPTRPTATPSPETVSPSSQVKSSPTASESIKPSPTPSPTKSPAVKPASGTAAKAVVKHSGPADERKLVALTFDDGPDPKWTPLILDILNKAGVKGTFFVVGKQVEAHPDVVKRIAAEGHAIGNHSWGHANMTSLTPEEMKEQVVKTSDLIASVTGKPCTLFRPPYGAVNDEALTLLASLNTQVVNWSVDTKDWAGTPVSDILSTVNHQLKPGGIILQHSFGGKKGDLSNTVEALPQMIANLKKNGYTFVTVPDMLP